MKKRLNAGKYNKLISICTPITDNGADDLLDRNDPDNLAVVLETWAEVKTTKGMTLIASGSDFEKAFTRFTIRYPRNTVIDRRMKVVYKNRIYRIDYINNIDEEDTELELQCMEVTQ